MQRPNEQKRKAIEAAAAELFAARPFHEVRLDDVAAAAGIAKGTLYTYFESKEQLYTSLVRDGFTQLVEKLRALISTEPPAGAWDTLGLIVRELVGWACRNPDYFQLMREHQIPPPGLREKRRELAKLIEATIRRGVGSGELHDPRPDLTAQFVPAFVRSVLRHGPADVGRDALTNHILRVLGGGILPHGTVDPAMRTARTEAPPCDAKRRGAHGRVARATAGESSRRQP